MYERLALVLVRLLAAKQMDMSPEELAAERLYRIQERLGILCGSGEPTIEQIEIAEQEAEEWVRRHLNSTPEPR